jgi:hypothetical protein
MGLRLSMSINGVRIIFGEYIDKLIFGAHTLNANVPFLLMISNEMVADINVLCSCMLNQIVGELDSTLIIT